MWKECRSRIADEAATGDYKGKKGKAAGANPRTLAKDPCTYCGRSGHKEATCFTKRKDQKAGGPLAATAQDAQSEPEPQPSMPVRALQLTEFQPKGLLPSGFLLPLAQAEAKVVQIEAELDQLNRNRLAPLLRRAMVDTGAGATVFPRGFSKHSVPEECGPNPGGR